MDCKHFNSALLVVVTLVALAGLPGSAQAQNRTDDEGLSLYAGGRLVYDTDFFRIDNSLEGTPGIDARGLADTTYTVYAGGDWVHRFGSQKISLSGEVNDNFQDKYTEADYTGGNFLGVLDWKIGAATFGDITVVSDVGLVNFENQDVPIVNIRTRNGISGALNRQLSPRWSIGAGGGYAHTNFDAGTTQNVERTDAFVRVAYESRRGNEIALVGDAAERKSTGLNNLGYKEFAVGPEIRWNPSQTLQVNGTVKYQERNPGDPTLVAFDGLTGSFGLRWNISDKVSMSTRALREISSLGDQLSNFAIIDRLVFNMDWNISRRLSYYVRAQFETRDFALEPTLLPLPDIEPREDTIISGRFGIRWDPRRRIHLEGYAEVGNRTSNRQFRDFRYDMYLIEIQYNFL